MCHDEFCAKAASDFSDNLLAAIAVEHDSKNLVPGTGATTRLPRKVGSVV